MFANAERPGETAVLDINVIVSAGVNPEGAPAQLIMDWVLDGQVQVVTCPLIVEAYRKIVQRPKFHRFGFPPLWLEFLIEESMRLPDPVSLASSWARPERPAVPCAGVHCWRIAT